MLLKAVAYWLDRYGLAVSERPVGKADFTGPELHRRQRRLPAKTILAFISLICAVLFFANIVAAHLAAAGHRRRPAGALGAPDRRHLPGARAAVPGRSRTSRTRKRRTSSATSRRPATAYGIDDVRSTRLRAAQTDDRRGSCAPTPTTDGQHPAARPDVLARRSSSCSRSGSYYDFPDHARRRPLHHRRRAAGRRDRRCASSTSTGSRAAAQLDQRPHQSTPTASASSPPWATRPTDGGRPSFVSPDIPPTGRASATYQPRIYFGEESPTYRSSAARRTGRARLPGRHGGRADNTTLRRQGRRRRRQPVQQAAVRDEVPASRNILLPDGQRRLEDPLRPRPEGAGREGRAWLTLDGDPYPAVVDGRILWIVDGYTTSNGYPYSTRSTLDDATADSLTDQPARGAWPSRTRSTTSATRSRRPSTPTTARSRSTQWDDEDPVLKTWKKAFPGTVKPQSDDQRRLMAHLRYPRGPVQGAARAARALPRHRPADVLQRQRLLAGPGRPDDATPGQAAAAVLPDAADAGPGRARRSR